MWSRRPLGPDPLEAPLRGGRPRRRWVAGGAVALAGATAAAALLLNPPSVLLPLSRPAATSRSPAPALLPRRAPSSFPADPTAPLPVPLPGPGPHPLPLRAALTALWWGLQSAAAGAAPLPFPAVRPAAVAIAFLVGGIAASLSHALAVPIDVVKTRKQLPQYEGMTTVAVLRQILTQEPQALLGGFEATAWGYFVQGSLKYGLFFVGKLYLAPLEAEGWPRPLLLVLAALAAESVASTVLCAFEAVRINQVARPGGSLLAVGGDLWREGSLFAGIAPLLLKMGTYSAAQLSTYDLAIGAAAAASGLPPQFTDRLRSAAMAAVLASLASQPGDTVLSVMAQDREGPRRSVGAVLRSLGIAGAWRGWDARLAQMLLIVVAQLLLYDTLSDHLNALWS